MANDALTSHLSPDYFLYGKGIAAGPDFFKNVLFLGFQMGFGAGLIAGAFYLVANNSKPGRPALPYRQLVNFIVCPLAAALLLAVAMGISSAGLAKSEGDTQLADAITGPRAIWFWRVWYIHLGLYVGLALGTLGGIYCIRHARKLAVVELAR